MHTRSSIASVMLRAAGAVFCCALVVCLMPAPATAQFRPPAPDPFVCDSTTPGGAAGAVAGERAAVACGSNAAANGFASSAFGTGTQALSRHSIAIGGGDDRDRAAFVDSTSPHAVAIGTRSSINADSNNSVAVGYNNSVTGANSGAFGTGNTVNGSGSFAIGDPNTLNGNNSFVLGDNNNINTGNGGAGTAGWGDNVNVVGSGNTIASTASAVGSSVTGNGNTVNASAAVVIANGATVTGGNAIAIGNDVHVAGTNGIAVGKLASADYTNSVAIGAGATATRDNQQVFGTASSTYTLSGVASSASRAAQSGPVQVVTSDSGGNLATASLSDLGLASIGDINAINARLNDLTKESRRGIAATAALAVAMTPSAPGKTTVSVNTGFFKGETGMGVALAHRLNFSTPFILHGSYANAGGNGHVGRVGFGFEF
jgi:autotransporter adhesin